MKKLLLLLVSALAGSAWASAEDTYALVTDASSLASGDKILIVNTKNSKALGTGTNTKKTNRSAADVTISNDEITSIGTDVQVITLESVDTTDGSTQWNFNVGDSQYLYASSSSSNYMSSALLSTASTDANAKIEISGGVTSITFQGSSTHNTIFYNSGSKIFSCYASSSSSILAVDIYKLKVAASDNQCEAPSIKGPADIFYDKAEVTITAETGATIYYTTDGSAPTTESSVYSDAFEISSTTTVKAIAVVSGKETSSVTSKTFTFGETYSTIADLVTAAPTSKARISGPLTIVYVGNKYMFVKDAAGTGLMFYGSSNWDTSTYKQGQTLSNVTGTFGSSSTKYIKPQFTPDASSLSPQGDETVIEPTEKTASELGKVYNQYVKLTNEKVTLDGTIYYIGENNAVQLYSYIAKPNELTSGISYDLEGMYVLYDSTPELLLTKASVNIGSTAPEAPTVTYNGETVAYGTKLEVYPGDVIDVLFTSSTSYVINENDAVSGSATSFTVEDKADEVSYTLFGKNDNGDGANFSFSYQVKVPANFTVSLDDEAITGDTYSIYKGVKVKLSADGATSYTAGGVDGNTYKVTEFDTPITFTAKNAAGKVEKTITFSKKEANIYEKATTLVDGDKYIVAATKSDVWYGMTANSTNLSTRDITSAYIGELIVNPSGVLLFTLKANDENWNLMSDASNGLNIESSTTTKLDTPSTLSISFNTDGTAKISSTTDAVASRALMLNGSNIKNYTPSSSYAYVQLYRLIDAVSVEKPELQNEDGTAFDLSASHNAGDKVVVKVKEGLHILYQYVTSDRVFDDGDWTSATELTYALEVGKELWVKAANDLDETSDMIGFVLTSDNTTTGVGSIAVDQDGAAEYYNLQGVRVVEPTPGLYIKRVGGKASKVIVK